MSERGCYVDLVALKRALNYTDYRDDLRLLELAESASRQIDSDTGRHFYTVTATRYFGAKRPDELLVPDLLSVTTLKTDSDGDRTYETTWASTDYDLDPANGYPKWQVLTSPNGVYSFPRHARSVEIAGVWGHGDGESASPWKALSVTATVATTDGTTVTTSSSAGLAIGQTWLVESEQLYVTDGGDLSWTVERGVNGTTAAAHSGKAISVARYPKQIVEACRMRVEMDMNVPVTGAVGTSDVGTITLDGRAFARYRDIVGSFKLWGVG